MSDTAQLDASTAAVPSQGNDSAPPSSPNNGIGAPPSTPTGNATETGTEVTPQTPQGQNPPADTDAPPASLTTPKSVASTAQPTSQAPASDAVDPNAFKRLRDSNSELGRERARLNAEVERMRAQMVELQQFREEQVRKSQAANLKRWDPNHAETSKFNDLLSRRERARQQLMRAKGAALPEDLTPQQAAAVRQGIDQIIAGDFSDEENAELNEFDKFQKESLYGLTTNMPATIGKIVQPMIAQGVQQALQEFRIRREVQRDQEDPELKPLFDRFGDDMAKAMADGVPYEQAVHYTKVYGRYEQALEENARLKQQMAAMSGKVSEATVQQELAKGKASITRDVNAPKPTPFKEALKWARENGVDTDSDAFRRKIRSLSEMSNS